MGIGHFIPGVGAQPGKIHLVASFDYDETDASIIGMNGLWHRAFNHASFLLKHATDGQVEIGTVFVANNKFADHEADVVLLEVGGTALAPVLGLKTWDAAFELPASARQEPQTIVHELGHHAFGLKDEYQNSTVASTCTGDTHRSACIMDFGNSFYYTLVSVDAMGNETIRAPVMLTQGSNLPVYVAHFCTLANHHLAGQDTDQGALSCAQTIAAEVGIAVPADTALPPPGAPLEYPNVVPPTGNGFVSVPGTNPPTIGWELLLQERRFCLVLDISGSMAGDKEAAVRAGAKQWVAATLNPPQPEKLAIVGFNQGTVDVLPLSLPGDFNETQVGQDIDMMLQAGGNTDIGGAMLVGRDHLTAGQRAATQSMVLLSDGLHNPGPPFVPPFINILPDPFGGTHPSAAWGDLLADGVPVFTIAVGPNADAGLLQQIGDETAGVSWPTPSDPLDILNELTQAWSETHSHLAAARAATLPAPDEGAPAPPAGHDEEALQAIAELPFTEEVTPDGFDLECLVPPGAAQVKFIVNHELGTDVNLYVIEDESGSVVDPRSATFRDPAGEPWVLYSIDEPAGLYRMRVVRASGGSIRLKLFAIVRDSRSWVSLLGPQRIYAPGEAVDLGLRMRYPIPLTGLEPRVIRAVERDPTEAGKEVLVLEEAERGTGWFEGRLAFDRPGRYEMMVVLENHGAATGALQETRPGDEPRQFELPPGQEIPEFRVLRRFAIRVAEREDDAGEEAAAS